jgi:NADPH:quinone reductase-like Zn-dependent oxidoreductase
LTDGSLEPVIGLTLPLEKAATAHHEIIEGNTLGKIVLVP